MTIPELMAALRAERLAQDMTAQHLARALGVTKTTLSDWENGRHEPGLKRLMTWASLLDLRFTITAITESPEVQEPINEDIDLRAERLLGKGLTYALEIRDHDPGVIRKTLLETAHRDLVDMVMVLAAAVPVESDAPFLRWWDGQGIKLADLISACVWCEAPFVRRTDEPARRYCGDEGRSEAGKERRNSTRKVAA